MKCPICDGMGTSNTCVNETFKPCSFCDGTGEVKDNLCETCGTICPFDDEHLECDNYTPLTNEGWLRKATTEQLAEFLLKIGEIDEAPIPCCDLMECSKNCGLYSQCAGDDVMPTNKEIWLEWLKQPHTPKE